MINLKTFLRSGIFWAHFVCHVEDIDLRRVFIKVLKSFQTKLRKGSMFAETLAPIKNPNENPTFGETTTFVATTYEASTWQWGWNRGTTAIKF